MKSGGNEKWSKLKVSKKKSDKKWLKWKLIKIGQN